MANFQKRCAYDDKDFENAPGIWIQKLFNFIVITLLWGHVGDVPVEFTKNLSKVKHLESPLYSNYILRPNDTWSIHQSWLIKYPFSIFGALFLLAANMVCSSQGVLSSN